MTRWLVVALLLLVCGTSVYAAAHRHHVHHHRIHHAKRHRAHHGASETLPTN
jgi:hypothetical protein